MISTRRARALARRPAAEGGSGRRRSRGQALVEFALVFPIFILVVVSLIEFAFAFDAILWLNSATRDASLLGAEAGNNGSSDCVILMSIEGKGDPGEKVVRGAANVGFISQVVVYKANKAGTKDPIAQNVYARSGSKSCTNSAGTPVTVPYHLVGSEGYPPADRCNELAGCGVSGVGVDVIGVEVTYQYHWVTPFPTLLPWSGSTFTLVKSNVMRMEPIL